MIMRWLTRYPLARTVPVVTVALVLSLVCLVMVYRVNQTEVQVRQMAEVEVRSEMNHLQGIISGLLEERDIASVQRVVSLMGAEPYVESLVVIDDRGQVQAASRFAWVGKNWRDLGQGWRPDVVGDAIRDESLLVRGGEPVGVFHSVAGIHLHSESPALRSARKGAILMRWNLHPLYLQFRHEAEHEAAWLASAMLAVSLVLFVLFRMVINSRLRQLVDFALRFGRGERVHARLEGGDEIAQLSHSLDSMADQLTERERHIRKLAETDALTGLMNRNAFIDRLQAELWQSRQLALFFINIDRFRKINETYGHRIGDAVLVAQARNIGQLAGETGWCARQGVDEFLLAMPALALEDANGFARRIHERLGLPMTVSGVTLQANSSIGMALLPDHASTAEELLINTGLAVRQAKEEGGNCVVSFSAALNARHERQNVIEAGLRESLLQDGLGLWLAYQPQLNLRNGRVAGVEALLRWNHPTLGMVPPDEFIQVAESCGLILSLGDWVMERACAQLASWRELYGYDFIVAINLSAAQLCDPLLVDKLQELVVRYALPADRIELELTESMLVEDMNQALDVLHALEAIGIQLSIDDFGTGYSNLAQLRQLPIKRLKIDRSFIQDIETNSNARGIVDTVMAMARTLDMTVVAEGAETDAQAVYLAELGCDYLQGWWLARGLPPAELETWLSGFRPTLPGHVKSVRERLT